MLDRYLLVKTLLHFWEGITTCFKSKLLLPQSKYELLKRKLKIVCSGVSMICNIDFITLTILCQDYMPSGAAEDWNLIEICVMKAVKCHHHNLTFDILSIVLCDGCT